MKKIIIVGVTGLVGREMLKILYSNGVPISNISGAASNKSTGRLLEYGSDILEVQDIANVDFGSYNIVLFSAGSDISKIYAPNAIMSGCTVIDNTSYFRMNPNIPLVVPEININSIKDSRLIANPNCSTIQMVLPLKPLHDIFELRELVVSTYQAAGGSGQKGIIELLNQTNEVLNNKPININHFPKQLAFNLIPQIDQFADLDYTREEWKMINETKKILALPSIDITATCVRVPVMIGHAVSVFARFNKSIDINRARNVLQTFDGIALIDDPSKQKYVTPIDAAHQNKVFVSRLRKHPSIDNALSFWCVADNLRKGAALNAIQIAQAISMI